MAGESQTDVLREQIWHQLRTRAVAVRLAGLDDVLRSLQAWIVQVDGRLSMLEERTWHMMQQSSLTAIERQALAFAADLKARGELPAGIPDHERPGGRLPGDQML